MPITARQAPLRASSPFDTLECTFRLLTSGPGPLALDAAILGLPAGTHVPLDRVREVLLERSAPNGARQAALAALLGRAKAEGGPWTVGLAGVLLFGLRAAVAPLCHVWPGRRDDIEAEALAGLLEAVAATSPSRPGLGGRLVWLARNRAKALVRRELAEQARAEHHGAACAPTLPYGHPDLVLARAVAAGVVCPEDAALVGETRLGGARPEEAARALGIGRAAAYKRRRRAEAALARWLAGGDYAPGFVQKPPRGAYSRGAGRPRRAPALDRPPAASQRPTTPRR
jgi:hypothetical protein